MMNDTCNIRGRNRLLIRLLVWIRKMYRLVWTGMKGLEWMDHPVWTGNGPSWKIQWERSMLNGLLLINGARNWKEIVLNGRDRPESSERTARNWQMGRTEVWMKLAADGRARNYFAKRWAHAYQTVKISVCQEVKVMLCAFSILHILLPWHAVCVAE